MKRIFVFCVLTLAVVACNKDKVESTPHLKFKSFSKDVINSTGELRVTLDFTDQEGDLDSLFVVRQRTNINGPDYLSFFYSGFPEFGNQTKGEVTVSFDIQNTLIFNLPGIGTNPNYERDTLLMKFYVKDKAGHVSDTATTKPLYVIR